MGVVGGSPRAWYAHPMWSPKAEYPRADSHIHLVRREDREWAESRAQVSNPPPLFTALLSGGGGDRGQEGTLYDEPRAYDALAQTHGVVAVTVVSVGEPNNAFLAEAAAEYIHERARQNWGYGVGETLGKKGLIDENYRGIRPAFGYPACPDHSLKGPLLDLLDAGAIGLELTENGAMIPAASVSGLYFAHPQAHYFTLGRLGRDQIEDYARRMGRSVEETERWLSSSLAYDA